MTADRISTRLISPDALSAADISAWQKLADGAIDPNPFYEPAFVLPAIDSGERSTRKLRLLVLHEADNSAEWLACLPITPGRINRLLPVWQAWNGPYVFLTSPLLAGRSPGRLVAALIDSFPRRFTGKSIAFGCLPEEDLAGIAFHSGLLETGWAAADREKFERAFLNRRSQPDEYTAAISSHHRREANRRNRRLADEVGAEIELTTTGDDADALATAIDEFIALENSGWKGEAGTSLGSRQADSDFFRSMCESFGRIGRVEILVLRAAGKPLAAECILIAGEGCFTFKIAHDEHYARFSPGIAMVLAQVRWFHERGVLWSDSCADPDNRMINRLWPDRRRLQSVVLIEPGRRGATPRMLLRLAKKLKSLKGNKDQS